MADATGPTTGSTTGVEAGTSGGQTSLDQAVETAVSKAMAEMQAQLNSLSENINKLATSTDTDTATVSRSSIDPAASQRRLETVAEISVSNAVSFQSAVNELVIGILARHNDHYDLGRFMPRSNSGPGTQDTKANA